MKVIAWVILTLAVILYQLSNRSLATRFGSRSNGLTEAFFGLIFLAVNAVGVWTLVLVIDQYIYQLDWEQFEDPLVNEGQNKPGPFEGKFEFVAEYGAWSLYRIKGGNRCLISTTPKDSIVLRGGKPINVNRDPVYVYVQKSSESYIIGFLSGFPMPKDKVATLTVGSTELSLATHDSQVLAQSSIGNDSVILKLNLFRSFIVSSLSVRNSTVLDTFSSEGFRAAFDSLHSNCP